MNVPLRRIRTSGRINAGLGGSEPAREETGAAPEEESPERWPSRASSLPQVLVSIEQNCSRASARSLGTPSNSLLKTATPAFKGRPMQAASLNAMNTPCLQACKTLWEAACWRGDFAVSPSLPGLTLSPASLLPRDGYPASASPRHTQQLTTKNRNTCF